MDQVFNSDQLPILPVLPNLPIVPEHIQKLLEELGKSTNKLIRKRGLPQELSCSLDQELQSYQDGIEYILLKASLTRMIKLSLVKYNLAEDDFNKFLNSLIDLDVTYLPYILQILRAFQGDASKFVEFVDIYLDENFDSQVDMISCSTDLSFATAPYLKFLLESYPNDYIEDDPTEASYSLTEFVLEVEETLVLLREILVGPRES